MISHWPGHSTDQFQKCILSYLWRFCLLEVANDGKVKRREEAVVGDCVILPPVDGTRHIVVGFLFESGTSLQIKLGTLDVVKLEAVLFKDTSDPACLNPKQGGKEHVEDATTHTNERGTTICSICCMEWRECRTKDSVSENMENVDLRFACSRSFGCC